MTKFTTNTAPVATDELQYSNADYEFANTIITAIKRQERLPLNLTAEDVFGEIRTNAPEWYEMWPDATQDDQLIFSTDLVKTPQKYLDKAGVDKSFQLLTGQVLMPPAVFGIYEVFYSGSGYVNRSLLNYANWSLSWLLLSTSFGAYPRMDVDSYMGSVFCMNLLNSLSKEPVVHQYNRDSHILQVYDIGNRCGNIICKVARALPIQTFYNNAWFRMFIMGHVIQARADHFELFGSPAMPGDLQINVSVLRNRADKFLDRVKEQLDREQASDFYIIKS